MFSLSEVSLREDLNCSCVYRLICTRTGKMYIGRAKHLKKRLLNHIKGIQSGKLLRKHIQEYGVEAMLVEVLQVAEWSETFQIEIDAIKAFQTFYKDSPWGLNANRGGRNFGDLQESGFKGKSHSDSLKLRYSFERTGRGNPMAGKSSASPITKRGAINPNFGKARSAETKSRISNALCKRVYTLVNVKTQETLQVSNLKEWCESMTVKYGIRFNHECLRLTQKGKKGYQQHHQYWKIEA